LIAFFQKSNAPRRATIKIHRQGKNLAVFGEKGKGKELLLTEKKGAVKNESFFYSPFY